MFRNFFRYAADFSHLASKGILIFTIHKRRSAEGISLLTQLLYTLIFFVRYLDLFYYNWKYAVYNTVFKLTYIATSLYTLWLLLSRFPRTREGEREWKIVTWILAGATILAPIGEAIFREHWNWLKTFRTWSVMVESVTVLPQLTLLAHTSIPTAITSYYLLALGMYRALYIPNWIWRSADKDDGDVEVASVIFGVIQTLVYVEFAWIYWKRQKVRLRSGGGVLDREEFARGLVLGRLIGIEEGKTGGRTTGGGWRGGGLSVSADDFVVGDGEEEEQDGSGDEIEEESGSEDGSDRDVERGLVAK